MVRRHDARQHPLNRPAEHDYHFFLKCVRLLGEITTQGDGSATADFDFQTNSAGDVFAFDMYPEGAPLGDKSPERSSISERLLLRHLFSRHRPNRGR